MPKKTLTRIKLKEKQHALTGYKYSDTDSDISKHGKLAEYWSKKGFKDFYKDVRKPYLKLKENFFSTEPFDTLINFYQWKGIEFGKWTTNEDRYNYLLALILASHDLNITLGFKNNIGLFQTLSVAFGARGQGKALAHFEPNTFAINLTRYHRADKARGTKEQRFFGTGGIGSLAHEYGHALDYFFGQYVSKSVSLSGGDRTYTHFTKEQLTKGDKLVQGMNRVINACIWDKKKKGWSDYYKNLKLQFEGKEYWFRHNEIWARLFEQYVGYCLKKKHIDNFFLAKLKYEAKQYLPAHDFKRVYPLIRQLLSDMAKTAGGKFNVKGYSKD